MVGKYDGGFVVVMNQIVVVIQLFLWWAMF